MFLNMPFFSWNHHKHWERGTAQNLSVTDQLRIKQVARYAFQESASIPGLPSGQRIRDACVGMQGILYLLDEGTNIWRYYFDNALVELWQPGNHFLFSKHASIAAHGDSLFVADMTSERKIAAYHVATGQTLWVLHEWRGEPLLPLALHVEKGGVLHALCLLDSDALDAEGFIRPGSRLGIWKLSSRGEFLELVEHEQLTVSPSSQGGEGSFRRYRIEHVQGRWMVLDQETREWVTLQNGNLTRQSLPVRTGSVLGMALDSQGNVYVADARAAHGKEARFLYQMDLDGRQFAELCSFQGNADRLFIDDAQRMILVDGEKHQVHLFQPTNRTKGLRDSSDFQGIYYSQALDSTESGTVWHKIRVNADIPDDTFLEISYYAADTKQVLLNQEVVDLDDYLARLDETALPGKDLEKIWSKPIVNPKDALLTGANGRYIWFRIRFKGSEKSTPALHSMRIYFPRETLLQYLPAIYQDDKRSKDFLERFLSLFGTFLQEMDEKISQLPRLFDVHAAEDGFLRWLGKWLGITGTEQWSDSQLRKLILAAPQLYREKGTRRGMERIVELFTGEKPHIIEYFQTKQWREIEGLQDWISQLFGDNPYCFCVMVREHVIRSEEQRNRIQRLIEEMKPALTEVKLIALQPWMYLGSHSFLGINTYLSEPSSLVLDNQSALPYHTMLVDDRKNRMDVQTRLGVDSGLE